MNKIKKDDIVKVISGKDKGKEGKVLAVDIKNHKVAVEKVNMVTKHVKAGKTKGATESSIVKREQAIDISNVMLVVDGKATKIGFKEENGKKYRVSKKSGKIIK